MFIWMELLTSLPDRINDGKMDRAGTIRLGIDICEVLIQLAEYNGDITYSDFNNSASGSYYYWYCCGENFFRQLLNVNGSIPAGKYYVDLYWDGMFVKTQSFEVK